LLFAWSPTKALAEISDEQALSIADKAIAKFDVDVPPGYPDWIRILKAGTKLVPPGRNGSEEKVKEVLPDTKARIGEIEGAIQGKQVWLVV
jgi:hypothetical protein